MSNIRVYHVSLFAKHVKALTQSDQVNYVRVQSKQIKYLDLGLKFSNLNLAYFHTLYEHSWIDQQFFKSYNIY